MSTGRADHPDVPRAGTRIGGYILGDELGRGGAATVFLATDVKHDRSVALKLLNADTSSALGGDRFKREIDVVAKLHHPHILPLHDSGEVDGLLYYVMPLVTGETLRDRIARGGPLPVAEVRQIMTDVAAALDYAHRHGVVHRDVKPANILLDDEHATIADFGIAHRARGDSAEQLTTVGMVIGTPTYMSPEQSTGSRDVDARTDIYALGCVAFEMLTGLPPFRGPNVTAVVTQHLQAPVPSVRELRTDLASDVDDVLRKALAKDPAHRYASARDFGAALGEALTSPGAVGPVVSGVASAPQRRRRISIVVAAVVALLVAALATFVATRDTGPPSIAVLPFTNMSDSRDNEYFSEGITEELTGALAQVGRFRVTPRTTAFAYKDRAVDIRQIARELGVRHILEGSVRRDRDSVRIVAVLHDVETGARLVDESYDREFRSVLTLQTSIAATIAEQLKRRLLPAETALIADRHSSNPEAYESYLKGRHEFDKRTASSLATALTHFKRAIELDSSYARAHAGLADTYSILAWTGYDSPKRLFELADTSAKQALALDSTLAEAHVSLGIVNGFHWWDWAAAQWETKRAIQLDSTLARAWFFLTWHQLAAGKYDSAMAALRRADSLDPASPVTKSRIASLLYLDRKFADADSVARATLEAYPGTQLAQLVRARALSAMGRHSEAVAALPPDSIRLGSYEAGVAGYVYARAGQRDWAHKAVSTLRSRAYVPGEAVAAIYAGLGQIDSAFIWVDSAIASRGIGLITFDREPMYDTLRNDSRYKARVRKIGVGTPGTPRPRQ